MLTLAFHSVWNTQLLDLFLANCFLTLRPLLLNQFFRVAFPDHLMLQAPHQLPHPAVDYVQLEPLRPTKSISPHILSLISHHPQLFCFFLTGFLRVAQLDEESRYVVCTCSVLCRNVLPDMCKGLFLQFIPAPAQISFHQRYLP